MEIQEGSLPGFYCSRIFGLAPYLIQRNNNKDRIIEIRRSRWLCVYSVCFMVTMASLSIRYLFIDSQSKAPIRFFLIRMRSGPSKFVTRFEVFIVVSAVLCGAMTGLFARKFIQKINSNLRKIDDELSMFDDDMKKDKRRNFIMVAIVFVIMTVMLALDIVFKWRSAENFRAKLQDGNLANWDRHFFTARINMESYLPFYVQYYVLMALHTQLAQTVLGMQRRYHRLNLAIKHLFPFDKVLAVSDQLKVMSKDVQNTREALTMKTKDEISLSSNINTLKRPVAKITPQPIPDKINAFIFDVSKYSADFSTATFLNQLMCYHAILGKTVATISSAFGMTMVLMLMSCLLTLVSTCYFLFVELITEAVSICMIFLFQFSMTYLLHFVNSLLFDLGHFCHVYAIAMVLFSHITAAFDRRTMSQNVTCVQANETINIVCEAQRNCKDSSIESILQRFWRQLLADHKHYFTAFGLCTVDRQILTSICAAITTYLIILIQFAKNGN
ncbi:gustatory receptor for sugar taste 43a-like [Sitodiplosis mosellana]|uniref:gustatory receptor for sugar taste 43a-like n=1 Tax=Sitodiplosis mosellana TaxID=263140 RepID=UPI002443DD80|nr:gustatory receptor for sugar taste 43a-like [Sitodiplosis mosellana]